MSKDQSSQNNLTADDDVTYVFYGGVRTAARKPILHVPLATASAQANAQTKSATPKAQSAPLSQTATTPAMQMIKVSPSAAKPWLDDSVILSAKPQNKPLQEPAIITPQEGNQVAVSVTIFNTPTGEDALIPASVSASEAAKTEVAKDEETEEALRTQQTPLRQRPQLQLPQLRPSIQLPPLFAATEVVKTENESAALSVFTAAKLSMPLRKMAVSAPADNVSNQESTEPVTNEMLLQEIAQLRSSMSEMQRTLQEIQTQLQNSKTP